MLKVLLSLFLVLVLLVVNEFFFRKRKFSNEVARKIIHISVASFVAFWPYFMSYSQIFYISVAFFVVILTSRMFHIFDSIHAVNRKTWGELFFPISIALLALFMPSKIVFLIAMLNVGIADGLAALIGKRFGKTNSYKLYGQNKSAAGTITFILASFAISLICKIIAPHQAGFISIPQLILVPLLLALSEAFGVYGSDDLFVPLMALVSLSWL